MKSAKARGCRALAAWILGAVVLLLDLAPVQAQRSYSIIGNQVVVDAVRHWENWRRPTHLTRINSAGSVQSRPLRTIYNVLDDHDLKRPVVVSRPERRIANIDSAAQLDVFGELLTDVQGNLIFSHFVRPGISRAGSNLHLADNILDGDPTTFWEPNPNDPIENWWIEVDLGRAVPVERLKLQFVDEDLGDPFFQFIMQLSRQQSPFFNETVRRIGLGLFVPHDVPVVDQRQFIFESNRVSAELPPATGVVSERKLIETEAPSPEWTGKNIETIRISITDTRGGRAEQITEDHWNELPPHERGDIVYFAQDVAGREEPVQEETYLALDPERQGRRDFYRRELPRLAEVEAWGWGDNVGLTLIEGGGAVELTTDGANSGLLFDGDLGKGLQHQILNPQNPSANVLTVDLGGVLRVKQLRILGSGVRGYIMQGSTGERDAQGELKWRTISPEQRESNVFLGNYRKLSDIFDPAQPLRFFNLVTLGHVPPGFRATGPGGTGHMNQFWATHQEIMIFSEGAPAEVELQSDLIELPGLVILGGVHWEATTPPGTEVEIRTRTGDQLLQQIRYFDKTGNSKTVEEYRVLAGFLKGPSDTTLVSGPGWSPWSQKYRFSGEPATSPSLRRFMQLQVRLKSESGDLVPELDNIQVDLTEPVAQSLMAEVWPTRTLAGQLDTFEVFVQPNFLTQPFNVRSPGFDELLLGAEPGLDMHLLDIALGTEEELAAATPALLFDQPQEGGLASADGQALQVLRGEGDSLWVRFDQAVLGTTPEELEPIYFREVEPGDEVPTGLDRNLLTFTSYSLLPELEKGSVRYFQKTQSGGEDQLREVDQTTYEGLDAEERGPTRYFRLVTGLGDQVPFDAVGEPLDESAYNLLGSARGWVVSRGRLLRLRFTSAVYLQGTRMTLAVRNSREQELWQQADGGETTGLSPSRTLAIGTTGGKRLIDAVEIAPNPFTPNGDGVNDVVQIQFALIKVQAARPLTMRIFALDGRRLRTVETMVLGGRQSLTWDGMDDAGKLVPPGLYICQIEIDADADNLSGRRRSHLLAVAY